METLTSEEGGFAIQLPETANETSVPHGRQFTVKRPDGAYLVSYDDDVAYASASESELASRLESSQKAVEKRLQGKLVRAERIRFAGKAAARDFEMEIPGPAVYRARVFLVNGRMFLVTAVGDPSFVASDDTKAVLDSFTLLISR